MKTKLNRQLSRFGGVHQRACMCKTAHQLSLLQHTEAAAGSWLADTSGILQHSKQHVRRQDALHSLALSVRALC